MSAWHAFYLLLLLVLVAVLALLSLGLDEQGLIASAVVVIVFGSAMFWFMKKGW